MIVGTGDPSPNDPRLDDTADRHRTGHAMCHGRIRGNNPSLGLRDLPTGWKRPNVLVLFLCKYISPTHGVFITDRGNG